MKGKHIKYEKNVWKSCHRPWVEKRIWGANFYFFFSLSTWRGFMKVSFFWVVSMPGRKRISGVGTIWKIEKGNWRKMGLNWTNKSEKSKKKRNSEDFLLKIKKNIYFWKFFFDFQIFWVSENWNFKKIK